MDFPERPNGKATDSPWFWIYLFSTFALVGLLLIQAKFVSRQSAIERKGLGRRMMLEQQADSGAKQEKISAATKQPLQTVSLRPLILLLAAAICVGWIVFWSQHVRRRRLRSNCPAESAGKPGEAGDKHDATI